MTIILDTETTGLDPEKDEILQVSIISETGETLIDQYVRPTRCTAWPDAERVNHITPDMVRDCPTIHDMDVSMQISRILEGADKIIGYNTQFDISFLIAAGYDVPVVETVDVMREFAEVYGDYREELDGYKWQKLTTAAAYYGYEWPIDAHNSLGDCLATLYVYQHMQQQRQLRPCPFCGLTECLKTEDVGGSGYLTPVCYVNCSPPLGGCGATGPICHNVYQAIDAWNRRAEDKPHGETELRHGRWITRNAEFGTGKMYECSECHKICEHYTNINYDPSPYCMYCGARMDGDAREPHGWDSAQQYIDQTLHDDPDDDYARCDRCGKYVDRDSMYAGICAECQAEDEDKSKQAGWYKVEEILKEVLPDDGGDADDSI